MSRPKKLKYKHQLTEWVDDISTVDFAIKQLTKYRKRRYEIHKNKLGQEAVFIDCSQMSFPCRNFTCCGTKRSY